MGGGLLLGMMFVLALPVVDPSVEEASPALVSTGLPASAPAVADSSAPEAKAAPAQVAKPSKHSGKGGKNRISFDPNEPGFVIQGRIQKPEIHFMDTIDRRSNDATLESSPETLIQKIEAATGEAPF